MAKTMIGVFVAVFIGAIAYEIMSRTKPEITDKFKEKMYAGLDNFLMSEAKKA